MITYEDYNKALIINKSPIRETDFPLYSFEAKRLIMQTVTQPIPDKYADCVKNTACKLCHQLYIDYTEMKPTAENGAKLKSQSESSGDYSYSFSYADTPSNEAKQAVYRKIITDGLIRCNGEWTGLFYAGINNRRCGL